MLAFQKNFQIKQVCFFRFDKLVNNCRVVDKCACAPKTFALIYEFGKLYKFFSVFGNQSGVKSAFSHVPAPLRPCVRAFYVSFSVATLHCSSKVVTQSHLRLSPNIYNIRENYKHILWQS